MKLLLNLVRKDFNQNPAITTALTVFLILAALLITGGLRVAGTMMISAPTMGLTTRHCRQITCRCIRASMKPPPWIVCGKPGRHCRFSHRQDADDS